MLEIAEGHHRLATEYPSHDSGLPSDQGHETLDTLNTPRLCATLASNAGNFARQAQSVYLLDQVLRIIRLPPEEDRLQELTALDGEIQTFLTLIMDEGGHGLHSDAGATAIRYNYISISPLAFQAFRRSYSLTTNRSLYLVHKSILTQPTTSPMEARQEQKSRAALDTAAKMILDAAHDHSFHMTDVDSFPLCFAYNLEVAIKHTEGRCRNSSEGESFTGLDPAKKMVDRFRERWRLARVGLVRAR